MKIWPNPGSASRRSRSAAGTGWLAGLIVDWFGLNQLPALTILAVMAAFLVVVHLGFASATELASSMIPIVIAVMQKVQTPGINVLGMTLVLQFVVSFGFILPVNSPQGMVAYGTHTFVARDFVRAGDRGVGFADRLWSILRMGVVGTRIS